jgi:beta-hydroxylase
MNKFIFFIFFIILLIYLSKKYFNFNKKINKLFYEPNEINNNLISIDNYKYKILEETINVYNSSKWNEWPEKDIYNGDWKIFPFFGFNIWNKENCEKCPTIYNFIKNIKGLKLAILSKLSPKTKLDIHQGWGNYSNYIIKCHYGLIVPDNCYLYVEDENNKKLRYHKQFEWIIFDDSKLHYSENLNDKDRIILMIDVERPNNVEIGKSNVEESAELLELINHYKKNN